MDFKEEIIRLIAACIIVFKRSVRLVSSPYVTMRSISAEKNAYQLLIIFFAVFSYFYIANGIKHFVIHPVFIFLLTVAQFIVTVLFFYSLSKLFSGKSSLSSFVYTFAYGLVPTLVWFSINTWLYEVLPPPRTASLPGKSFSIVFVAFSVSVLLWKLILVYLGIRFSSKRNFYSIVYMIVLYMCVFLPYTVFMYRMHFFRVPFI